MHFFGRLHSADCYRREREGFRQKPFIVYVCGVFLQKRMFSTKIASFVLLL